MLAHWKKSYNKPRQWIKKQRHYSASKSPYSQSYGFSSSRVWMWELDHKEGWAPKNWCFQTVVLEKTLESPLDSNEIKPVNPKGNQPWMLIGRTDAEAEVPIFWPHYEKSWLIGKKLMLGKSEGGRRRGLSNSSCQPRMPAVVLYYCTFQGTVLEDLKCFLCVCFLTYYLCEKYYKPIIVQCYIAYCVSWVPRLFSWTYECTLRMECVHL